MCACVPVYVCVFVCVYVCMIMHVQFASVMQSSISVQDLSVCHTNLYPQIFIFMVSIDLEAIDGLQQLRLFVQQLLQQ